LAQRQKDLGLSIRLAHVNYPLRGKESDDDEHFCRSLAEKLSLPLDIKVCSLRHLDDFAGNIQNEARRVRMEFFEELAECHNLGKIVLARTLDDQVETIFGNILQGSGLNGFIGMSAWAGRVVRPLLSVLRKDIMNWLHQNRLPFREDSSNRGMIYTHNRLRHKIIPLITAEINPGLSEALIGLSATAREACAHLEKETTSFRVAHVESTIYGNAIIALAPFLALYVIMQKYLLKRLVERLSGSLRGVVRFDLLAKAGGLFTGKASSKLDLDGGVEMGVSSLKLYGSAYYMIQNGKWEPEGDSEVDVKSKSFQIRAGIRFGGIAECDCCRIVLLASAYSSEFAG